MKILIKAGSYLACMLTLALAGKAVAYDAVFDIKGRVAANTCVMSSSKTQNVNLGDHYIGDNGFGLKKGSKTAGVRWDLDFRCEAGTKLHMRFAGNTYGDTGDVLAIPNTTGSAKGIGIQTKRSENRITWHIIWFGSNAFAGTAEATGNKTIYLESNYVQAADTITAGTANANMTVEITYE